MNLTPARRRRFLQTLGLLFCWAVVVGFMNGTFNSHCDYKLSSGTQLRVVRNGPYTVGFIQYRWACDLRLVRMNFAGALPVTLSETKSLGGGECTEQCDALQRVEQKILIGDEFYSSDSGDTFVDPIKLTSKHSEINSFMDQRFSLAGQDLIVHAWSYFEAEHTAPPTSFASSDGGKTWRRLPSQSHSSN